MDKPHISIVIVVCFCVSFTLSTQSIAQSDSLMEKWAEFAEDETELIQLLQQLTDDPLNINFATKSDLLNIPFFTPALADTILEIRKRKNGFKSKRMLRPVLGKELYGLIKDFITAAEYQKTNGFAEHKSYYNLPREEALQEGLYRGNGWYDYNKVYYRFTRQLKAGWVSQKDAGESSYLDYTSGFIRYQHRFGHLILGKYRLRFGQGLVFANPFAGRKSAMVTAPFRHNNNGGTETLSSSENQAPFGLYARLTYFDKSDLFIFIGRTKRDAQISRYTSDITGIDYDGYHRTDSEMSKKDKLSERLLGLAWQYAYSKSLRTGLLFSQFHYDPEIQFSPTIAGESVFRRQRFKFSGERLRQYSIFYNGQLRKIAFAGELAFCDRGSPAYSQSIFFLQENIKLGIKYWLASKNFQSPYGRVFAEANPFPQAKQGIYAALEFKPREGLIIKAYKLLQKELWRGYTSPLPQVKNEWLCQLELKSKIALTEIRLRQKRQEDYILNTYLKYERQNNQQLIARLQNEFKPSPEIGLKSRFMFTKLKRGNESGRYFFQDIKYIFFAYFRMNARVTFFQTDSYSSRLYEYENDLPGSFSNFALYGRGYTWYVLLKWQPFKNISLHLKFRYFHHDQKDMSSLYLFREQIDIKRSVRFRIKFKF